MHTDLRKSRGAAYILALVTLLVGSVLSLALLQASATYFLDENSRTKKGAAVNLALAGVDYAYWQVHYQGLPLPYSGDVTLTSGSFHVDASDDGSRDRSTMVITSTGTSGGYSYTIKRVTLGLLPYHYAWCENGQINENDAITSTSLNRGIRANDLINLSNYGVNINTGLWSTSTITTHGTGTPQYPSGPPIAFPDITYSSYASIATVTYNNDTTFTSLSYPSDAVIYVNGNATLNLFTWKYRGACTVVATGNIVIKSNLTYYDTSSYLALITSRTITVQSTAPSVVATLYAHRSDNGAQVPIAGREDDGRIDLRR